MSFSYQNKKLYCEDCEVENLLKIYKTPLYLYSGSQIKKQFHSLKEALKTHRLNANIHFSVKSNSNLSILKLLYEQGSNFDIVSIGEFRRLKKIGVPGEKIVFAGVGKTEAEIEEALNGNVLLFNVESLEELKLIEQTSKRLNKKAPISLRINPDIDAGTHAFITTGTFESKFGIPWTEALKIYENFNSNSNLEFIGLDMHIGSQLTDEGPIDKSLERFSELAKELLNKKIPLQYLDVGGGLGIKYAQEKIITVERFTSLISKHLSDKCFEKLKIIVEPGRYIVGEAGILVGQILYEKKVFDRTFYILDAAMNDLIRPALYESFHEISSLNEVTQKDALIKADIVGPVCESADVFGKNRNIKASKPGEYLYIKNAGAYGSSMSSNYNTRPKPAEVLVEGITHKLIKKRETFDDLIKLELDL